MNLSPETAEKITNVMTPAIREARKPPTGDELGWALPRIIAIAERVGVSVNVDWEGDPDKPGCYGATSLSRAGSSIVIRRDLSLTGKVHVLAHEMGHVAAFISQCAPALMAYPVGEMFAETFAYLFCLQLGEDHYEWSNSYLTGWRSDPMVLYLLQNDLIPSCLGLVQQVKSL